jgi:hypothetical protein
MFISQQNMTAYGEASYHSTLDTMIILRVNIGKDAVLVFQANVMPNGVS